MYDMNYSEFISKLKSNNMKINRKVLADLAVNQPDEFKKIIEKIK